MPTQKILQTTTYNFKLTDENGVKGYKWCDDIKMSFQGKDSNGTVKEIINMIKVNDFQIELSIKSEIFGVEPDVIFLIFEIVCFLSPGLILSGLYPQKKSRLNFKFEKFSNIGTHASSVQPG